MLESEWTFFFIFGGVRLCCDDKVEVDNLF